MSLNTLSDLDLGLLFDEEALQKYCLNKETWADSSNQISMEEASSETCELLLTDYLLNFDEENFKECSYDVDVDVYSSGVECSDSESHCSLASLKKSLKKSKSDFSGTSKGSSKSRKNTELCKGASASPAKKGSEKYVPKLTKEDQPHGSDQSCNLDEVDERRAKDRLRSRTYRAGKTQKVKKLEEDCNELRTNNNILSEKNETLLERITALEEHVEYLESVITNQSALATILSTLTKHSGLEFQRNPLRPNSLKRSREDSSGGNAEEGENKRMKGLKDVSCKNGGVCLHLAPGRMSLEFCKECHKNSNVEND